MSNDSPDKPHIRPVSDSKITRFNPGNELLAVLPDCLKSVEEMKYAEAFEAFAAKLEHMERHSPEVMKSMPAQRDAKKIFGQLWKAFIRDTTDRDKLSRRLDWRRDDETAPQGVAPSNQTSTAPERLAYDAALEKQRAEKKKVVVFPTEGARKSYEDRLWDSAMRSSLRSRDDPAMQHMQYVGALYNHTLPLVREMTEGYVKPMLPSSWYSTVAPRPLTSRRIRACIVNFLKAAPEIAGTLGELNGELEDSILEDR